MLWQVTHLQMHDILYIVKFVAQMTFACHIHAAIIELSKLLTTDRAKSFPYKYFLLTISVTG